MRDSLPAAIESRDAWREAFDNEARAAVALRARGDSLQSANDDLAAVVRNYGNASEKILGASKPSFISRLVPEVGVGAAVGIDPTTLKPSKTVGVTLTWSL